MLTGSILSSPYSRCGSGQPPGLGISLTQQMGMWRGNSVTQLNLPESLPTLQCGGNPASALPSCHSASTSLMEQPCQTGLSVSNPVQQAESVNWSQGPGLPSTSVMPTLSDHVEGGESHPESIELIQESMVCIRIEIHNCL